MKTIPHGSKDYQRLNPHLFSPARYLESVTGVTAEIDAMPTRPPKRLRQSSKPLMNKLEQEWFDLVSASHPNYPQPHAQSVTFKLGNGVTYCPDVFCFEWPAVAEPERPTAFEVKGDWFPDDARKSLKIFAHQYPEIRVILVYKREGHWVEERVLP